MSFIIKSITNNVVKDRSVRYIYFLIYSIHIAVILLCTVFYVRLDTNTFAPQSDVLLLNNTIFTSWERDNSEQ